MLLLSSTTSPLNPQYGNDAALFRLVGTAMADGKQLYVDIWDHKGPALFLIEWLGQEIAGGRAGIFLVQILFLYGTLLCFDSFAARFLKPMLRIAAIAAVLAFYASVYEHGNLTEEYSLFFCALALVLITREWGPGQETSTPLWMFGVAGAAFAFVVFIRLNNGLPILAVFLTYFVMALIERTRFWAPLAASLIGFSAVVAGFVGGFALAGSLREMMYATFFFNARYVDHGASFVDIVSHRYFTLTLIAVGVCLLGGVIAYQTSRGWRFLALSWVLAVLTLLAVFISPNTYLHYAQIAVPAFALGVMLSLRIIDQRTSLLAMITIVALSLPVFGSMAMREKIVAAASKSAEFATEVHDILDAVPEGERNGIYTWEVPAQFYLVADTLPRQRFFMHQEWWGASDPKVITEAVDFVKLDKPRWIVLPAGKKQSAPEFQRILDVDYVDVRSNDQFRLYERHD